MSWSEIANRIEECIELKNVRIAVLEETLKICKEALESCEHCHCDSEYFDIYNDDKVEEALKRIKEVLR